MYYPSGYCECQRCHQLLPIDRFRIIETNYNKQLYKVPVNTCKKCEEDRLDIRKKSIRNSYSKARIRLLKEMGGKCVCCGLTNWWILHIDRIVQTGERINSKILTYMLLRDSKLRVDYQLLCSGCSSSRGSREKCKLNHSLDYKEIESDIQDKFWD